MRESCDSRCESHANLSESKLANPCESWIRESANPDSRGESFLRIQIALRIHGLAKARIQGLAFAWDSRILRILGFAGFAKSQILRIPRILGFAGFANPANLDSRIRGICLERESFLPLDSRFANPAANPMRIKR